MVDFTLITQLFVLLNPIASFPFLLQAYKEKLDVKMVAVKSVIAAFVIGIIMVLIGPFLFSLFGITLDSFRVAGGVVLFVLGIDMVRRGEEEEEETGNDGITTIIATPLLTGPATISFLTIKSYEMGTTALISNVVAGFLLVGIVFFLFSLIVPKVNIKIVSIASKIMGLFVTAVAIEMIAKGVAGIITAL